jgi:hypothetical protein
VRKRIVAIERQLRTEKQMARDERKNRQTFGPCKGGHEPGQELAKGPITRSRSGEGCGNRALRGAFRRHPGHR